MKYIFCTYDVWGDEVDFEINNICRYTDKPFEVNDDATTDDILKICATEGFLNAEEVKAGHVDVDLSCAPDYIEFWDLGSNLPVARIEKI